LTGDVADSEEDVGGIDLHRVVPVSSCIEALHAGQVAHGELETGRSWQVGEQHGTDAERSIERRYRVTVRRRCTGSSGERLLG
jgi:hypothetical protein